MKILMSLLVLTLFLSSCGQVYRESYQDDKEIQESINTYEIQTSYNAKIPDNGSGPITGVVPLENPDTVIIFTGLDDRFFVPNGKDVNFVYDGIDPDETYIMFESALDGYYLTLKNKYEGVDVKFNKICQLFIVGNPSLTRIQVPSTLKYEQIIWTPRKDGTWELRIGSTERGCKSKSLDELQKMRTKSYEEKVPK